MPLDDLIRAALHEAAQRCRFPEHLDGLALPKRKKEENQNG